MATAQAGRVALVTGAAQGIGRGVAARLAAEGMAVALLDRAAGPLHEAHRVLASEGARVLAIEADVSKPEDVALAMAAVDERFGRLDVLVNNAALVPAHDGKAHAVEEMPLEEWDAVLAVNLTGVFLCCRAAIGKMRANGFGRIVNMGSQGGRMRSALSGAAYGATKAGLIGFSRVLAGEVARAGITVNVIAPGRIDTPGASAFGGLDAFLQAVPVGRIGESDDIAAAVSYLVSEEAGFVTGAVLDVNGGLYMP